VRSHGSELPGPRHATRWAEELRPFCNADCFLGLLQIAEKVGIRVTQNGSIHQVVVADLVSASLDTGNHLWVAESPLADQEEGGLGVMLLEDLKHFRREGGVRAIIEGKGNPGTIGPNSIENVGRQSLQHTEDSKRLYPKRQQAYPEESHTYQEHHLPCVHCLTPLCSSELVERSGMSLGLRRPMWVNRCRHYATESR
jgi:hypothetical protein